MIESITTIQPKLYEAEDKSIGAFVVPEFEYYYLYAQNNIQIKEYKSALTAILEVAGKEYHFNKLVLSLRDLTHTPIVGRAWFATYFAPAFYKKLNKEVIVAVVKPQNRFEAITIDVITNSLPKMGINIKVQVFEDKYAAIKWIENPIFD